MMMQRLYNAAFNAYTDLYIWLFQFQPEQFTNSYEAIQYEKRGNLLGGILFPIIPNKEGENGARLLQYVFSVIHQIQFNCKRMHISLFIYPQSVHEIGPYGENCIISIIILH